MYVKTNEFYRQMEKRIVKGSHRAQNRVTGQGRGKGLIGQR